MKIKNIRSSNRNVSTWLRSLLIAALLLSFAGPMQADYLDREEVQVFIDELVEVENIDREWLEQMFLDAEYSQSVIDAISRPAEKTLAWAEYQKIFLTQSRLESGIEFWRENAFVLDEAEAEFGVPPEIVLAIIGVETLYGRYTGGYRVIDSLSTLAFDYPPRASFFKGELKSLVKLANQHQVDPASLTGSYAGAMGLGQFIPSSYLAYSADYDGDGFADLWSNPADAIWSVANYLSRHGWSRDKAIFTPISVPEGLPENLINQNLKPYANLSELHDLGVIGLPSSQEPSDSEEYTLMQLTGLGGSEYWVGHHNFYVITRYNHSHLYGMAVAHLAHRLNVATNQLD
jgi:membrane-bound lytic murein transglycosylase B